MKKYIINVQVDAYIEHEIKAESMEDALGKAKYIDPGEILKLKSIKKSGVIHWEINDIGMVMSA